MNGAENGGFETGEGEIEAVDFGVGKGILLGIAVPRTNGDGGSAGVGQAEDFGDFVETFADSVVAGGADDFEMVMGGHVEDLGVAAGDDKSEKRKFWCLFILVILWGLEPVGVDVGFEVVDGVEGLMPENGKHAGGQGTDHEGAHETGGVGDGDGVDVGCEVGIFREFSFEFGVLLEEMGAVFRDAGFDEGLMDDGKNGFEMGAGGNFWYNTTVSSKNVNLRNDDVAEDFDAIFDHGGGSFVARTFNSKDSHGFIILYILEFG